MIPSAQPLPGRAKLAIRDLSMTFRGERNDVLSPVPIRRMIPISSGVSDPPVLVTRPLVDAGGRVTRESRLPGLSESRRMITFAALGNCTR